MSGYTKWALCFLKAGFSTPGLETAAKVAQIELHGFRNQVYVHANGISYLGANGKGFSGNNFPGLEGVVDTYDKRKFWVQKRLINAPISPSSSFTKAF